MLLMFLIKFSESVCPCRVRECVVITASASHMNECIYVINNHDQ